MTTFIRTFGLLVLAFSLTQTAGAQPALQKASTDQAPQAITLWWVVFNQPENCFGSSDPASNCTGADVFGQAYLDSVSGGAPDPALIAPNMNSGVAVLYAGGGITGARGQLDLTAALYKTQPNQTYDLPSGVDPMGFGKGLESDDAEIHLVVRSHGDAEKRDYISQITNFLDPYCSDPNLHYVSGPNLCSDVQFAVFGSTESGSKVVYPFAEPVVPVRGAKAYLSRHDDVVRVVVKTRIASSDF